MRKQNKAACIVTGATKLVSIDVLIHETGYGTLLNHKPVISLLAVPRRHFCFVSSKLFFFLGRCIPVVSIVYICLIRILALRSPVLQFKLPSLLLVCVLFVLFFLLFVVVLSGEPRQKQG